MQNFGKRAAQCSESGQVFGRSLSLSLSLTSKSSLPRIQCDPIQRPGVSYGHRLLEIPVSVTRLALLWPGGELTKKIDQLQGNKRIAKMPAECGALRRGAIRRLLEAFKSAPKITSIWTWLKIRLNVFDQNLVTSSHQDLVTRYFGNFKENTR